MGQQNSRSVQLENVTEIKKSATYHGNALVATTMIEKGTKLLYVLNGVHGELLNDSCFIMPQTYDYDSFLTTFSNYKESGRHCQCNVRHNKKDYFAKRDIFPGEELTKHYGCPKWSILLVRYIWYDTYKKPISQVREDEVVVDIPAFYDLQKAVNDLKVCKLTMTTAANRK